MTDTEATDTAVTDTAVTDTAVTDTAVTDPFAVARSVADAVLFEGYVLYPYRTSSSKNQMRWQFGVLVPGTVRIADGYERSGLRTECLIDPGLAASVRVRIRCLQVQQRLLEAAVDGGFEPVHRLHVGDTAWSNWDEAVEREIEVGSVDLGGPPTEHHFSLAAGRDVEELRAAGGEVRGRAVRVRQPVEGLVRVSAEPWERWRKVTVTVDNVTPWEPEGATRDEVMRRSLVAVHTLLAVTDGQFVSLLEPPEGAVAAARSCTNEGTFPVLVGGDEGRDVVLSSPIILYDHPAVAPESAGDLFDATEIDEILSLRVLTLTDEEKAEARGTDARAAAIVDRCDDMAPELWERLHGAVRSLGPAFDTADRTVDEEVGWWEEEVDMLVEPTTDTIRIGGVEVGNGTKVRLRPSRRADAHDIFLAGLTATVAQVVHDADGDVHVAVLVDDDPAADLFEAQRRYLYFHPDEVEVL